LYGVECREQLRRADFPSPTGIVGPEQVRAIAGERMILDARADNDGRVTRRETLGVLASALMLPGTRALANSTQAAFDGAAMYREVVEYDNFGEHRVGGPADDATTEWLSRKLADGGLAVTRQPFSYPLYTPIVSAIDLGTARIETFPAWPPASTGPDGLKALLAPASADDLSGKIALIDFAYGPGAAWSARGLGGEVMAALARGAVAAIVITEGPTGGVIALNAEPEKFAWPKPVVIAAGKDRDVLSAAAATLQEVMLTSTGQVKTDAVADNVVGRRSGTGKTVVITTPKSGWFNCAGERGTGIALFLEAARWLVRETDCDLLFGCSSGHEIDYMGSHLFMKENAPAARDTRLWLHIGANAAVQATDTSSGTVRFLGTPGPAQLTVSEHLVPQAASAFEGLPGYDKPIVFSEKTALGELEVFQRGGYSDVVGMLGAWPLFHTRADRAAVATSPSVLASVGRAMQNLLRTQT
jgi:hypothetical protein